MRISWTAILMMVLCSPVSAQSQSASIGAARPVDAPTLPPAPSHVSVPTSPRTSNNPLATIPLQSLTATRDRPIFVPSRRPPQRLVESFASPAAAAVADRPQLVLIGAIADNGGGLAIFRDELTHQIVRVRVGEVQSGWTLQSLRPREATLSRGPQVAVLSIPLPTK